MIIEITTSVILPPAETIMHNENVSDLLESSTGRSVGDTPAVPVRADLIFVAYMEASGTNCALLGIWARPIGTGSILSPASEHLRDIAL